MNLVCDAVGGEMWKLAYLLNRVSRIFKLFFKRPPFAQCDLVDQRDHGGRHLLLGGGKQGIKKWGSIVCCFY